MNAQHELFKADRDQVKVFYENIFTYAYEGYISLRGFNDQNKPAALGSWQFINAIDTEACINASVKLIEDLAKQPCTVFCPPIATFKNDQSAVEDNICEGVALSVDIDNVNPLEAKRTLEALLGKATVTVESGGEWLDKTTGETLPKLHLHWRLSEPAATQKDIEKLKKLRALTINLVGADSSGAPIVHPMRWPGSWHKKSSPRLCRISELNESCEIHLDEALEKISDAVGESAAETPATMNKPITRKPASEYLQLSDLIRSGESYHEPLVRISAQRISNGMNERAVIDELEALMTSSEAARDARWESRFNDIPRIVRTALKFQPALSDESTIIKLVDDLRETAPDSGWLIMPYGQESTPDLSHDALALDLSVAGFTRDARYVNKWGKWVFWNGSQWEIDERLSHMTKIRDFMRAKASKVIEWSNRKAMAMNNPLEAEKMLKWGRDNAKTLRMASTITSIETIARSNSDLIATVEQFDNDLMLIGTPCGTVDLTTGELLAAQKHHWITKHCAVVPAEKCVDAPLWRSFLNRTFNGDQDLISFIQRAAGYALTGHTSEHKLLFLYGTGRNGKSVFLNTIYDIMGDYSKRASAQTFLDSSSERHPTDLAGLHGARLVAGSELPAGKAWNESIIKDLTGGDVITARFMRQDFFEYMPQFTLFIAGNHQPSFKGIDEAIRARVVLVPFTQTIPAEERDPELPKKLQAEWPAIFRWMIEGALEWQRIGLAVPESVKAASAEYLEDEDTLGEFIEENIITGYGNTTAVEMFDRFSEWQREIGISLTWTKKAMTQALKERGFKTDKLTGGVRGFRGVSLKPRQDMKYFTPYPD